MKKTDRQLGYILLMQSGKGYTAEQLADHFEICKRTVYRDIQAISEAGVPIISLPGKGYQLMEGYYLPPVSFTPDEAAALYLANQFARQQTDAGIRANLNTAMDKIEAVLPGTTRDELARFKQAVHLSFYQSDEEKHSDVRFLGQIREAIVGQRVLRLRYHAQSTDKQTTRTVEPMWLLYYWHNWHLIGYCRLRGEIRDFRLDRINHLFLTDETFILRQQYKLEDYLKEHRRFEGLHEVRVRFTSKAASYARRWFYWGSTSEVADGDYVIVSFMVGNLEPLWSWLLSFGSMAEVLAPESLRQRIADEALRVADYYALRAAKAG